MQVFRAFILSSWCGGTLYKALVRDNFHGYRIVSYRIVSHRILAYRLRCPIHPFHPLRHAMPLLPQTCFVPPNTSPCTFLQSILPSTSSSTRPTTATLSPRMM